jgi:hypothetical protein
MKKTMIGFLGVLMLGLVFVPSALGWERGTHAYFAELIKKGGGPKTVEAMYGSTVPDVFNYMYTEPGYFYRSFLYDQTHFQAMKVWKEAKGGTEKDAARGFVSHNNVWGADMTAHTRSLTLDPNEGYIITKAKLLNSLLMNDPGYAAVVGSVPDMALEICHDIVEAAGDIILKHADTSVGRRLVELARMPRPEAAELLVRAYADDLADFSQTTTAPMNRKKAERFIRAAEADFRSNVIAYGRLLEGDDETLIANIIEMYKSLAASFLGSYGIPVPDDATLEALISAALETSLQICQGDYMTEVMATAEMVKREIKKRLN